MGDDFLFQAESGPAFKDRKNWLVFFGILELIPAAILVFILLFLALGFHVSPDTMDEPARIFSHPWLLFAVLGAVFAVLAAGIVLHAVGVMKARRWARALAQIFAWMTLISVAYDLLCLALALVLKAFPSDEIGPMLLLFIPFIFFFGLAVLFVRFFGSPSVKMTCETRDPKIRWTDKRPLPVIAVCLMMWAGAAQFLFFAFFFFLIKSEVFPGEIESYILLLVSLILVIIAAVFAALAIGTWRLRKWSWWGVLILACFGTAIYLLMTYGSPEAQQAEFHRMAANMRQLQLLSSLIFLAGALAGMVYMRRYFFPKQA